MHKQLISEILSIILVFPFSSFHITPKQLSIVVKPDQQSMFDVFWLNQWGSMKTWESRGTWGLNPLNPPTNWALLRNHIFIIPDCVATWTVVNNTLSWGGYSAGVESYDSCVKTCLENVNCAAFGHNYKDGTCWIFERATDLNTNYVWNDGNLNILKSRCDVPPPGE